MNINVHLSRELHFDSKIDSKWLNWDKQGLYRALAVIVRVVKDKIGFRKRLILPRNVSLNVINTRLCLAVR